MGVARSAADGRRAAGPPGVPEAGRDAARHRGPREISVTTNGYLLERDAEALVGAGVDRFNVSLDSLARDAFFQITRRDSLAQVMRGLEAIARFPEVGPIKVNAVAMRDFTEHEVLRFCELARSTHYQVRFIEFMPLDADGVGAGRGADRRGDPGDHRDGVTRSSRSRASPHATARVYRFATDRARSGSSIPSRSRSAPTATGFGSPPTASFAPACSRSTRPTCAIRCARARATTSSSERSATRSGARSSSTASTSPASAGRRGP